MDTMFLSERFSFKKFCETVTKNLLRNLEIKKATDIITILPKLIMLSVDFLTLSLTKAINKSITQNVFPENDKTTSVILTNKISNIY